MDEVHRATPTHALEHGTGQQAADAVDNYILASGMHIRKRKELRQSIRAQAADLFGIPLKVVPPDIVEIRRERRKKLEVLRLFSLHNLFLAVCSAHLVALVALELLLDNFLREWGNVRDPSLRRP